MKIIKVPLKDQVVSLEVAKQLNPLLKKAGIEIEGNYWWERSRNSKYNKWPKWDVTNWGYKTNDKLRQLIPTFTLPELLRVMPSWELGEYYILVYLENATQEFHTIRIDDKNDLITAVAEMVIWCVENGYLGCIDETQSD
jgi:hypothetical protein